MTTKTPKKKNTKNIIKKVNNEVVERHDAPLCENTSDSQPQTEPQTQPQSEQVSGNTDNSVDVSKEQLEISRIFEEYGDCNDRFHSNILNSIRYVVANMAPGQINKLMSIIPEHSEDIRIAAELCKSDNDAAERNKWIMESRFKRFIDNWENLSDDVRAILNDSQEFCKYRANKSTNDNIYNENEQMAMHEQSDDPDIDIDNLDPMSGKTSEAQKAIIEHSMSYKASADVLKNFNIDANGTMVYSTIPDMNAIVSRGSSNGKDCKVCDIYHAQLPHYKEANESIKIGNTCAPKPVKSITELMRDAVRDLPKSMADKIVSIPGEEWKYDADNYTFNLSYAVSVRKIYIAVRFGEDLSDPSIFINYSTEGLGPVYYKHTFEKISDMASAGNNGKKIYDWLCNVIVTFYQK